MASSQFVLAQCGMAGMFVQQMTGPPLRTAVSICRKQPRPRQGWKGYCAARGTQDSDICFVLIITKIHRPYIYVYCTSFMAGYYFLLYCVHGVSLDQNTMIYLPVREEIFQLLPRKECTLY